MQLINAPPRYITVFGNNKSYKPKDNANDTIYLDYLSAILNVDIDKVTDKTLDQIALDDTVIKDLSLRPARDNSLSTYENFMAIILNEDGTLSDRIIYDIGLASNEKIPTDAVNIDDPELFALLEDGERWYTKFSLSKIISDSEIKTDSELDILISHLDKRLQRDAECNINYPVGNYRNFIMAFPTKYVYSSQNRRLIDFFTTDISSEDVINHSYLNPSVPLYTSGLTDLKTKQLIPLSQMNMIYMGQCNYESEYGIVEPYTVFRTDGYFTKLYETYNLNFAVQNK